MKHRPVKSDGAKRESFLSRWRRDDLLRRFFEGATILLGGNITASALGLFTLALSARGLSTKDFGMLVLITTYVLIADRLINFQSWQAIIKYGTASLAKGSTSDFQSLIKFGFILDGSASFVATIVAALGIWMIGSWQNWEQQYLWMSALYSLTVLTHISGTPMGILRIYNKYRTISYQAVVAAFIKLLGVCWAFATDNGLWGFLIAWAVSDIVGNGLLAVLALKALAQRKVHGIPRAKLANISGRFPEIWGFIWNTNVQTAIKFTSREIDIVLLGSIAGPQAVGGMKIIKQFSGAALKVIDPFFQVLLPEYSRLVADGSKTKLAQNIFRVSALFLLISALGFLLLIALGKPIIDLILGAEYSFIYGPLLIYYVAIMINSATVPFNPYFLSAGLTRLYLMSTVVSTAAYVPLAWLLISHWSIHGAAFAWVGYWLVWLGIAMPGLIGSLRSGILQRDKSAH